VRSRFLKLPFEELDRNTPIDFAPPPPWHNGKIEQELQWLISCIGPNLSRFNTDSTRVRDCEKFLTKLFKVQYPDSNPAREMEIVARTLNMTLQVYHTYTLDHFELRPIVKWFADVWVPQEIALMQSNKVNILGSFLKDVWSMRSNDIKSHGDNIVWVHNNRRLFYPGIDHHSLIDNMFHALHINQLCRIVDRKYGKNKYDVIQV
jgi:hypothetical protein